MNKKVIIAILLILLASIGTATTLMYYYSLTATGEVELSIIPGTAETMTCNVIFDGDQEAVCTTFSLTNQNNVEFQPLFDINTTPADVNCMIANQNAPIAAGQTLDYNVVCSPQRRYTGEYVVTVLVS